jgi:transcriptional regulator with XRE-family HTH domain
MLDARLIQEIDRLLRAGGLSQRQIAAQLRVSRGTVGAIASGRRDLRGKEQPREVSQRAAAAARCPECGYRVFFPCLICSTRSHKRRELLTHRARMENGELNGGRIPCHAPDGNASTTF